MTQFTYTGAPDLSLDAYRLGIPADFAVPKSLAPAVAAYDAALQAWDEALIAAEVARATLAGAPERDRQALADAIESGKPDPGSKHHATADRAALVADERLRLTARAVSAAAVTVEQAVRDNRADVLDLAVNREKAQIAAVSAAWQQVTDQIAAVSGQQTGTIGEHINWVMSVLGERTRIEPERADLTVIHAAVKDNPRALAELERIEQAAALVE